MRRAPAAPNLPLDGGGVCARQRADGGGECAAREEAHREAPGYVVAITPSVIALSRDDSFPIEGKRDFPGV